jgi:Protein of unknown function (DUF993)
MAMVGGQQSNRSMVHFCELFCLADSANALQQPELVLNRMKTLCALNGIE